VTAAAAMREIVPAPEPAEMPPGHVEFFFADCFREPHHEGGIDRAVGWALATDPETLLLSVAGSPRSTWGVAS
jgi:hypothetical protein